MWFGIVRNWLSLVYNWIRWYVMMVEITLGGVVE